MEALPEFPMMTPNYRTSTFLIDSDLKIAIKEYIVMHFQMDPCSYDGALDELAQLKSEINDPIADVEMSCKLKRYYGQLCMLEKRFPMSRGQQIAVPFSWYDSYQDTQTITYDDVSYEKASIMWNIGVTHARIAANEMRSTQDSIKNAFMHFQYAAYPFEQLRKLEDPFYPSTDLDPDVDKFYENIMLAQAQECLVQKSLLDNRSPVVIAKLSWHLHKAFATCAEICANWSVHISDRAQKEYTKFCLMKSELYATISYAEMGFQAENDQKFGARLSYFTKAAEHLKETPQLLKNISVTEHATAFTRTIEFLNDIVGGKVINAKKENDFIYHERLPREDEISEEMKSLDMCKVKSLAFDPLERSVCGEDLFGSLLPPTVLQSVSLYEERKAELKRNILGEVNYGDQVLESFLEKAGYDELRFLLNEGKKADSLFVLPDMLLERNAALTAQPEAIANLLDQLRETGEISVVAENKLGMLIGKLRAIDLPQLTSDEGYIAISKELERLHEHHAQAKSNNVSLQKAIAAHSQNLNLLSLPFAELRQRLAPNLNIGSSAEEASLRRILDKVEEMRAQRRKLIDRLDDELNKDDISTRLLAEKEFSHENTFQDALKKHDQTITFLRTNLCAQEKILHALTEANADFCDERAKIRKLTDEFNERVMVLVTAFDIYTDVCAKVAEGKKFYEQLIQRCDKLEVAVNAIDSAFKAEQEKRNREKREMEQRMDAMRRERDARNALTDFAGGMPVHMGQLPPGSASPLGFPPGGPGLNYQPPNVSASGEAHPPRLKDFMSSYRRNKANSSLPPAPQLHIPPQAAQRGNIFGPTGHEIAQCPSPTPSSVHELSPHAIPGQHPQFGFHPSPVPPPTSSYAPPPPSSQYNNYKPPPQQIAPRPSPQQIQPPQHVPAQSHPSHFPPASRDSSANFVSSTSTAVSPQPPMPVVQPLHQPQHVQVQHHFQRPEEHQPYQPPANIYQQYSSNLPNFPSSAPISVAPQSAPHAPHVAQISQNNWAQPQVPSAAPVQPQQQVQQQQRQQQFHPAPSYPPTTHPGYQQPPSVNIPTPAPQSIPQIPPQSQWNPAGQQSFAPPPARQPQIPPPSAPSTVPNAAQVPANIYQPPPQSQMPNHFQPPIQQPKQQQHVAPTQTTMMHPQVASAAQQQPSVGQQPIQNRQVSPQPHAPAQQQQQPPPTSMSWHQAPNRASGFGMQPRSDSPWYNGAQQNIKASPWHSGVNDQHQPQQYQQQPMNVSVNNTFSQAQPHPNGTSQSQQPPANNPVQQTYQPMQQQPVPQNYQQPPQPAGSSNVDLLSSLLGDFNLPPALQPTEHVKTNVQNLQQSFDVKTAASPALATDVTQPRATSIPTKPADSASSDSVNAIIHSAPVYRPAAAVVPIQHSTIGTSPLAPPSVLSMNNASTVSFAPSTGDYIADQTNNAPSEKILSLHDVVNPQTFQLGPGDQQKLDKRLLHASIRSQGAPPPLNPSDPLNQIDAFGNFLKPKF